MTVEAYIRAHDIEDFYCYSNRKIYLQYKEKTARRWKVDYEVHGAINLCHKSTWKNYTSYQRFAHREIVKIEGNRIYTEWSTGELIAEFEQLTQRQVQQIIWIRNDATDEIEVENECPF